MVYYVREGHNMCAHYMREGRNVCYIMQERVATCVLHYVIEMRLVCYSII